MLRVAGDSFSCNVDCIGAHAKSQRLNDSKKRQWCPGWESNPSGGLILRKLLILRNSKMEKNHKNAEVRYTAGTRNGRKDLAECPHFTPSSFLWKSSRPQR